LTQAVSVFRQVHLDERRKRVGIGLKDHAHAQGRVKYSPEAYGKDYQGKVNRCFRSVPKEITVGSSLIRAVHSSVLHFASIDTHSANFGFLDSAPRSVHTTTTGASTSTSTPGSKEVTALPTPLDGRLPKKNGVKKPWKNSSEKDRTSNEK